MTDFKRLSEQIRSSFIFTEQVQQQIMDTVKWHDHFVEQFNFLKHLNTSLYIPKMEIPAIDYFHISNALSKMEVPAIDYSHILNAFSKIEVPAIDYSHILNAFSKIEVPVIDYSHISDALSISARINEIVGTSLEWHSYFDNQLGQITNQFNEITKNLAVGFSALNLAGNLLPLADIFRSLSKLVEENTDLANAFSSAKWSIAPSMDAQLKNRVVELYEEGKSRYISNAIIGFYHRENFKNLKAMIESWREHPQFTSRTHIIDDALVAHINGLYTLSVPALLPLIEGILNDYVTTHNLTARCGNIKRVYEAVLGEADDYSLSQWAIAQTLLFQLEYNTYSFTDFRAELQKSTNRRQVSRHTVLHGISTNYHTLANSLRILVLLDAISALHDHISDNHIA
ncbi:MAG: hypothetical protein H6667_18155 [Ardenticatenaceae bacterium]|nr:hypothetical protein [Ardenticatenaceae bacterium]